MKMMHYELKFLRFPELNFEPYPCSLKSTIKSNIMLHDSNSDMLFDMREKDSQFPRILRAVDLNRLIDKFCPGIGWFFFVN